MNTSRLPTGADPYVAEDSGDIIAVKHGKTEHFHIISPNADTEGMRMVGALGEMLFEEAKRIFGIDSLTIVAENCDYKLIMFPRKGEFVVWKTDLALSEILPTLRPGANRREGSAKEE